MRAWSAAARAGRRRRVRADDGRLHDGHLSLVREARRQRCDRVVVSIFVNPLQFDRRDDFDAYPRPLDDDLARCAAAGVDAVFRRRPGGMYPGGFQTWSRSSLSRSACVEGVAAGHFRGVTTVVTKLLAAVRPDVAVFGEKDFQQLAIIRRMTATSTSGSRSSGADRARARRPGDVKPPPPPGAAAPPPPRRPRGGRGPGGRGPPPGGPTPPPVPTPPPPRHRSRRRCSAR